MKKRGLKRRTRLTTDTLLVAKSRSKRKGARTFTGTNFCEKISCTRKSRWDKCEDALFSANERSKGDRRKGKGRGKGRGGSMVEHQPRLLGFRVRFPAGAFAIFSVSAKASLPISLSLSPFPFSFPSSSFPFLFLSLSFSLRPFVCAKNQDGVGKHGIGLLD